MNRGKSIENINAIIKQCQIQERGLDKFLMMLQSGDPPLKQIIKTMVKVQSEQSRAIRTLANVAFGLIYSEDKQEFGDIFNTMFGGGK